MKERKVQFRILKFAPMRLLLYNLSGLCDFLQHTHKPRQRDLVLSSL